MERTSAKVSGRLATAATLRQQRVMQSGGKQKASTIGVEACLPEMSD
jgi:hypothetical protein